MKSLNTSRLHVHMGQMPPCWWSEGMLGYKPFLVRTVLSTERRNSHFLFAPVSQAQHSSCTVVLPVQHLQGSPSHPAQRQGSKCLHSVFKTPEAATDQGIDLCHCHLQIPNGQPNVEAGELLVRC